MTVDEIVGWHHQLDGHEFEQTPGSFTFHFHALEKEMATNSSILAWRIPRTAEAGGLQSRGLQRVGHN